jgi:hypothetical protein
MGSAGVPRTLLVKPISRMSPTARTRNTMPQSWVRPHP